MACTAFLVFSHKSVFISNWMENGLPFDSCELLFNACLAFSRSEHPAGCGFCLFILAKPSYAVAAICNLKMMHKYSVLVCSFRVGSVLHMHVSGCCHISPQFQKVTLRLKIVLSCVVFT